MELREKIYSKEPALLFYSFAPPKINTDQARLQDIAVKQLRRINSLDIDGLILYDIQDESVRTKEKRTFPFIETVSPEYYSKHYLGALELPKIIYKSIANHTEESFATWLQQNQDLDAVVFVGASSSKQLRETNFSLSDAYNLKTQISNDLLLGGITIPERHASKGDEHLRMGEKVKNGCRFFISQCVYNVHDSKNLLSDYYYDALDGDYPLHPIVFTLSPCGSLKTLEFMKWLGIEVPKWLLNELKHSKDILEASVKTCLQTAGELIHFAESKNIPFGFNIESVSLKKEEIDAAFEILHGVERLLARSPKPGSAITLN